MIDVDHGLEQARHALPIFPLPRSVLLPGAMLPLHVFEPRYRALVAHCRDGWELMGIATLKPGYEANYEGRPEVFPEVGIGRIVAFQPLPDGRSNILLQYVGRGSIVRELPSEHPFREVEVELRQTRPPRDATVYDEVRALVAAIGGLSDAAREEAVRLARLEGSELLDTLARKLLQTPDDQRVYLGEDAIERRGQQIVGALGELLASATASSGEA